MRVVGETPAALWPSWRFVGTGWVGDEMMGVGRTSLTMVFFRGGSMMVLQTRLVASGRRMRNDFMVSDVFEMGDCDEVVFCG